MAVVEITQLRLKALTADDPLLLESLSLVRGRLQTNSRFFSCIEDPSLIYIFGFWPSLDAHLEFLASPTRDEILGPQEDILDFQWTIHLDLNTISPSLLEAPFIAVQRFEYNAGHVDVYNKVIDKHVRTLREVGYIDVTYGWRCDRGSGSFEAAILTSWNDEGSVDTNAGRQIALDSNDGRTCCEVLFHRARNMEHMPLRA